MKVKTSTGKLIQSTAVEGQAQEQQDPETVADAIADTPSAADKQQSRTPSSPAASHEQLQGHSGAADCGQQLPTGLLGIVQQPGKQQQQQNGLHNHTISPATEEEAGPLGKPLATTTAAIDRQHDSSITGVKRDASAAGLSRDPCQQQQQQNCHPLLAEKVILDGSRGDAAAAVVQQTAAGSGQTANADSSPPAGCATITEAAVAAKRPRLVSPPRQWQAPMAQQQQQQHPVVSAATAAAAAAAGNLLLPGQLPNCFPLLATSAAAHNGSMPMGQADVAAQQGSAAAAAAVLPHHIPGIPVSWPGSRPVLGLPGSTIQAAAAAAAAAAATATRAAMGQDPTLGWTPAMAAAAMVAAAGAHEGAAVTAAGAAPRVRPGHHATRGRRHKLAAKDEDISSRQGSLRVLGSASVGGATKGVSAELSDAAQPAPPEYTAEEAAAAAAGVPLSCLGLLAAPDPPQQAALQHLMQLGLLPATAVNSQQQDGHDAAAAAGGSKLQPAQPPVRVLAGISNGPAAAEVQGFADEAPQAGLSGLMTDQTDGSLPLPPAAAEAVGSPPRITPVEGPESAMDADLADEQHKLSGDSPTTVAAAAAGSSPVIAAVMVADLLAAAAAAGSGGGGGFSKEELSRRFQQQQLRQQLLCLAALEPAQAAAAVAAADLPAVAGDSPVAAVATAAGTAATGATTVQGPSSTERQQQQGSGHNSDSAGNGGTPGSAHLAPVSSQQQQQQQLGVCGVPAAHLPAHWAPLSYQQALANAANSGLTHPGLVVASMPAAVAAAAGGPGAVASSAVPLSVNADGPATAGMALQQQAMAAAAAAQQRSGSDQLTNGPTQHQQGPQSGHNGTMLAAVAAAAAGMPPVSSQTGIPGLTAPAAAAAGMPGVTLPPPALVHLSAPQQPSLPHHMAVQHDPNAAAAAAVGNWMQPNQAWRSPWTNGNGTGHAAAAAAHLALNPSGGAAAAAANIRGLPITPTAAAAHLPALLPVAPLHPVAPVGHPVGPGQLLPVAPVLGHTTGARAPEPVTPAEASMTSAAARLQQLQQHEAATHTPSGVTTTDVAPTGEAETEQTLREVSRQLQQHVEQQQQQMAAEAAAAATRYGVDMQDAEQLAAVVVAAADVVEAAALQEAAADFAAAAAVGSHAQRLAGLNLSIPVAAAWVGVQQPDLNDVVTGQHPEALEAVLAGTKQQQKAALDQKLQQQQQLGVEQPADVAGGTQQLGNSGRSTSTAEQSSGGANQQATQQGGQQQQGSGSNGNGSSGNGSNGNGSGSGQTAAADPHVEQRQVTLPPPPPRQPGTTAAAAAAGARPAHAGNPSTQQAAAAAAAAIADANNAAVAIAAAAVAVAANAAAHAVAATGGSNTAQSNGTHLLGYVGGSGGGSGNGSGGNGSGGTGGSGSNGLHGSNMVASNALLGSNGIGSGAMGSGSGAMGSGTAGGGSGGEGSGPIDSRSEPVQLPASAAAAAAVAAQQQLLQAMFPAGLPGSAAAADPAAATALVVPPHGTGRSDAVLPASVVNPTAAGTATAPAKCDGAAAVAAEASRAAEQLHPAAAGTHAAAMQQQQPARVHLQQQQHGTSTPVAQYGLPQLQTAMQSHPSQQHLMYSDHQVQQHQLASSLAPTAAPAIHLSSPTAAAAQHLMQQQQQQAWWQQQQLLLAQQAYHWQTGLTHQAALLQHLPAAVAVMGLQGLTQWPGNALIGSQWSQQQQQQYQQQHQFQQQAVAAAAAAGGIAAVTQHHFAHLQQAAAQHPEQVMAAAAGQPAAMCAAAAAAAAAAAGVPVMDSGGLQGENILLPGMGGLNGSGGNGAGATDAAGGAADGSAGGATAGNGSGGTGGATGGTGGGSGNGSGGTAGGTGHGSGGTHGTGGTGGTNATYGTNGLNGSGGASWGLKGSNTVGMMGLTSCGNGSSWAAPYSGVAAAAAAVPAGHAGAHHLLHQHHVYSSHCAENTPGLAGAPQSGSQQQQQQHSHLEHHKPQSVAAQQQQQQFLQQCHSLMQQKLQLLQHPAAAAAAAAAAGHPILPGPVSPFVTMGGSQQQLQQQQLQQQQQQQAIAAATAAMRQPMGSAGGTSTANPAISGQALSLQNLLWLQQNAVSAVHHYQSLQQAQQQPHAVAGPIENTAALNSWVPSTLPVQATPGAGAAAMQSGAAGAAATADGGSGGADGSGGGTGGTGGGTGNGSNDPEATAGPPAAAGNYTSLVASSTWMPSQQQQTPVSAPISAVPILLQQQQQPPVSLHQGQPYLQTQVPSQLLPLQQLLPQLQHCGMHMTATAQPAALLQSSILNSQLPAAAAGLSLPGLGAAAGAAGGGSSGGGSLMGLGGNVLPPMSSGFAPGPVPPMVQGLAGAGGSGCLAGPPSLGLPPASGGLSFWPSSLTNAAIGLTSHELHPSANMLQQIMPNSGWAELGAQTAACFNAGLSPSLYWQYLTAAALLAQPPNSAAMVNAARAYHYFQQYLNPNLASDWMEDRTPSLASSAASEESAKESPNIERADRVSEAVDVQMEDEDLPAAAAAGDAATADKAAAVAGVGGKGVAAAGGRVGRKRGHAAETDSEQDEASSRRKYR